jgi:uncharacterized protein with FMN-binding domain
MRCEEPLMRRAIFAVAATIAGLVALLTFKTTAVQGPPAAAPAAPVPVAPGPRRGAGTTVGWLRGPAVDTKFGPVQVRVLISGGRITDVQAMRLPADTKLSQRISTYAGPLLQREVLRAQSARIDTVSGATYTSQGYRHSLQAALDSARR